MGCGHIADKFANDLTLTKHGKLAAVASRSQRKANKFAKAHNAPRAYSSYEELAADPDIDVVYIATPHPFHMDNALLAISNGKHVLCEKPIAMNARQTRRMIAAAQRKGVFLMEGMWTRFFPAMIQLRKWLAAKRIGTVLAVEADLGFHFRAGPKHRIHNPDLGGGALLDLGIYLVSFSSMVYGTPPAKILSSMHPDKTGVDEEFSLIFEYDKGARAVLNATTRMVMRPEARIFGTDGMIVVHEDFYRAKQLTLTMEGKKSKTYTFDHPGIGFQHEADHVAECLKKGKTQSDTLPLNETLTIMQTTDKIRRQWKLKYPNE